MRRWKRRWMSSLGQDATNARMAAVATDKISNLNKRLGKGPQRFAGRALEESYPYLILDARYEKVRENGVVVSQSAVSGGPCREYRVRYPDRFLLSLPQLIVQGPYGIVAGYEDHNDAGKLRLHPLFQIIAGKGEIGDPLASQGDLSRLENSISATEVGALNDLVTDSFIDSQEQPAVTILEVDSTEPTPSVSRYSHWPINSSVSSDDACYTPISDGPRCRPCGGSCSE